MTGPTDPTGFAPVARLAEVPEGQPLAVEGPGGVRLCLVRSAGTVRALRDECTHQAFPLSAGEVLADGSIMCPWHGARFDCRTGEPLSGPATDAVPVYDVRVEGEDVYVGPLTTGRAP